SSTGFVGICLDRTWRNTTACRFSIRSGLTPTRAISPAGWPLRAPSGETPALDPVILKPSGTAHSGRALVSHTASIQKQWFEAATASSSSRPIIQDGMVVLRRTDLIQTRHSPVHSAGYS